MAVTKPTIEQIDNPYKMSAKITSAQTLSDNTATLVALATEHFDTNSDFTNTAGNYKYTVPVTGYYQIDAYVAIYDAQTKIAGGQLKLYKNGVEWTKNQMHPTATYNGVVVGVPYSELVYLTAADYIQLYALVDTTDSGTASMTYGRMSIHLVST